MRFTSALEKEKKRDCLKLCYAFGFLRQEDTTLTFHFKTLFGENEQ